MNMSKSEMGVPITGLTSSALTELKKQQRDNNPDLKESPNKAKSKCNSNLTSFSKLSSGSFFRMMNTPFGNNNYLMKALEIH